MISELPYHFLISGVGQSSKSDSDENGLSRDSNNGRAKVRGDGASPKPLDSEDDESIDPRRKLHRPKSLTLSRQHSSNSSEESDNQEPPGANRDKKNMPQRPQADGEERPKREKKTRSVEMVENGSNGERKSQGAEQQPDRRVHKAEKLETRSRSEELPDWRGNNGNEGGVHMVGTDRDHRQHGPQPPMIDHALKRLSNRPQPLHIAPDPSSPTHSPSRSSNHSPPKSPSWRKFRESPPKSPQRKDGYPSMRIMSPPKSPLEREGFPAAYTDMSPPSRPLSGEGQYIDMHISPSSRGDEDEEQIFVTPRPSPVSPQQEDAENFMAIVSGNLAVFAPPPPREAFRHEVSPEIVDVEMVPEFGGSHSLDVASYAATVASDCAHLTNLSVSPTNLMIHQDEHDYLEISPESQGSMGSISPPSPNYYEEVDDIELADPAMKDIDYQGTKRQKVRPPTTDWSPITDLSPILDVSPSIEAAEQEEMLAHQHNIVSKTQAAFGRSEEKATKQIRSPPKLPEILPPPQPPPKKVFEPQSPLRRYQNFEDLSQENWNGRPEREIPEVTGKPPLPPPKESMRPRTPEPPKVNDRKPEPDRRPAPPPKPRDVKTRIGGAQPIAEVVPVQSSSGPPPRPTVDDPESSPKRRAVRDAIKEIEERERSSSLSPPKTPPRKPKVQDHLVDKSSSPDRAKQEKEQQQQVREEPRKIRRTLPEPTPEQVMSRKVPSKEKQKPEKEANNFRLAAEKSGDTRGRPLCREPPRPAPRRPPQGGQRDVRSSSLSLSQAPDRNGSPIKAIDSNKPKPPPLMVICTDTDEDNVSPPYKVLKSPVTPERRIMPRDYSDPKPLTPEYSPDPHELTKNAYSYPSPYPSPDSDVSPPKPQSPSLPKSEAYDNIAAMMAEPDPLSDTPSPHGSLTGKVRDNISISFVLFVSIGGKEVCP